MAAIMASRDNSATTLIGNGGAGGGGIAIPYSPAKEKASRVGIGSNGVALLLRRVRQILMHLFARVKRSSSVLSCLFVFVSFLIFGCWIGSRMEGDLHEFEFAPVGSTTSSSPRDGYTMLINTWKRNSLLKQAVAHYASCCRVDAIHIVWSESDPPPYSLESYLRKLVNSKSRSVHKPTFRFDLNEEDNLNNRFKPIKDIVNDAIFSVDDDVIVPCRTLDFAFTVWRSAPDAMVGFVPRMHWLARERDGAPYYRYGGWWSVWSSGTYSMVLSKAAFFHRKYLDLYTYVMPSSIHDYVSRERNCEDIAMSLLVSNATGASPIWVKGKIHEIGTSGISSLKGHNKRRDKCLNDFIALYGTMPLIPTNLKAVDARGEWFW